MEEAQPNEFAIEDLIFWPFSDNSEYDLVFKVAVGNCEVGKTFLIEKAKDKLSHSDEYNPTKGADISYLSTKIKGKKLKINIFDTSGDKIFQKPLSNLLDNTLLIILAYDITNNLLKI